MTTLPRKDGQARAAVPTYGALAIIASLVLALPAPPVCADGLIVPVRHDIRVAGSWAVKYHKVDIKVRDQVANVSIDQAFVNTGNTVIEVEYLFPLPPQAAIDAMTLLADGKEIVGKILPREEARRIYESIVRAKKDPALLEYVHYGLYKTSAFPLPPGKDVRVLVHYADVCRKDRDLVEVFYPLNTEKFSARPIEEVEVKVDLQAKGAIAAVYSPTHDLEVKRTSADRVLATYRVTGETPNTDFRLMYQTPAEAVGATVLSYRPRDNEDGYFLLMVSPAPQRDKEQVLPKDLVVLLDRSGSMAGDKLRQARDALRYVLKNLNEDDRFNVIAYCDSIDPLFDSLAANRKENIDKALDLLDRLDARGGTNIHDSLGTGLKMLDAKSDRSRYVLFLTDGQPTIGKTNENEILKDTLEANDRGKKARIFALGIGYDVNVRLLDRLVGDNRGVSDYIKEKEPLESKISSLYAKIKNPVMTDLAVKLSATRTTMTYPRVLPDLFDGGQIVWVGRYETPGPTHVLIRGNYLGKEQTFEYAADLAARSDRFSFAFVEQIWAVRRVGFLLDEIQLHGKSSEVIDELVRLSKQYGIITPYTSFLADERTVLADAASVRRSAAKAAAPLAEGIVGGWGQAHAANRAALNKSSQQIAPGLATQFGQSSVANYERGAREQVANVQSLGNRAFHRRGAQWIDANVVDRDLARLNRESQLVRQFSREYFDLVAANTTMENQILAAQKPGEELIVELRGQVYRIAAAE